MVFNYGPRKADITENIVFDVGSGGGKFNPLKHIIFPNQAVLNTDYKLQVDNNLKKWELALLSSNTIQNIQIKNSKENNLVKIFLIGAGESGDDRTSGLGAGNNGRGGKGGKYLYEEEIELKNGEYNFNIGNNSNSATYLISSFINLNSNSSTNPQVEGGRGGYAQGDPPTTSRLNGLSGGTGVYAFNEINNSLLYPTTQFGAGGGGGAYGDYGCYWTGSNTFQNWSAHGSYGGGGITGGGGGGSPYSFTWGADPNSRKINTSYANFRNADNGSPNTGSGGGGAGGSYCTVDSYGSTSSTTTTKGEGGSGIILIQGILP